MKSIITKRLGITAGLTGALFAAGSLQAQTFEPGIDFTADVVSNYVFRGVDVHKAKFEQDGKSYSSFNTAPAFQPSLTFKFSEGWSLNIWGSFAMTGRADKDTDGLLQTAPGDTGPLANLYLASIAAGNVNLEYIANQYRIGGAEPLTGIDFGDPVSIEDMMTGAAGAPGFYKEQNGLRRSDEVDLTLSYSVSSKLGTMTGGVVSYNYVNIAQQTASNIEMFAGFAPAILPELSFTTYVDVATPGYSGSTYNYLAYTKAFEFGDGNNVTVAPGIGYATDTSLKIQGWKNANLPVTLNIGGFHVGITGVYRADSRFFDGSAYTNDGVKLLGLSTIDDGLVDDPAGNIGIANTLINAKINAALAPELAAAGYPLTYTYTPRQSLPKLVYFYTIGYSTSF